MRLLNPKLVWRKSKKFDESFPDYLERLSFFNGFVSARDFIRYLVLVFFDQCSEGASSVIDSDVKYSGEGKKYRRKLVKCSVALGFLLKRDLCKEDMNLTEPNLNAYFKPRRICELCWKECEYYRYYWRLWTYRNCHKHRVSLTYVKNVNYKKMDEMIKLNHTQGVHFSNEKYYRPLYELLPFCEERGIGFSELDKVSRHLLWEIKAWIIVWRLLRKQFNIHSAMKSYEVPKWNEELNSCTSEERVKRALYNFLSPMKKNGKIVEIIVLIVFSFVGDVFEKNFSFRAWILGRAYEISPLLYVCLHGVNFKGFSSLVESYETLSPLNFKVFSPFKLGEFIKYTPILSDVEKELLRIKLDDYSEVEWDSEHLEYGNYIRLSSQVLHFCGAEGCCLDENSESSKPSEEFII